MKKILAKHKWLVDCVINEMLDTTTEQRYFVATVYGWKGFYITEINSEKVVKEVKKIRRKIEAKDENIFENPKYTKKTAFKILANKNKKGESNEKIKCELQL